MDAILIWTLPALALVAFLAGAVLLWWRLERNQWRPAAEVARRDRQAAASAALAPAV